MSEFGNLIAYPGLLFQALFSSDAGLPFVCFAPLVVILELPVYAVILVGIFRYRLRKGQSPRKVSSYRPLVSCVITCYSEGKDVGITIRSLIEQTYDGPIEILAMVDGAAKNHHTYTAARSYAGTRNTAGLRNVIVVPKWQRGGRVSSLNSGLRLLNGEVILVLDADTSFDSDMVAKMVRNFADPNIVGVSGNLRVRGPFSNTVVSLQAIEYLLSIYAGRTGLSEFNIVNNISGAFGGFRATFVRNLGGWDSGTAEDLDMTLRMKAYFARYPNLRIVFEPEAIGHTDTPLTLWGFLQQRLRWDGDLLYIYRKHKCILRPRHIGWPNFIAILWNGLLFQIVSPFIIFTYTVFTFVAYPFSTVVASLAVIYLLYLLIACVLFFTCLFLLSERKKLDLKLVPYLIFFPGFAFITRVWSCVAICKEFFTHSHLDSSMAPWWVLKKTQEME